MPSGAENRVARPMRMSVPTRALEMPPSLEKGSAGWIVVKKSHDSAGRPSTRIFPRISPSGMSEMTRQR